MRPEECGGHCPGWLSSARPGEPHPALGIEQEVACGHNALSGTLFFFWYKHAYQALIITDF
jgi:hypothetical protein